MISIIVPIYKVESYLPACLDSVLAQTETDWECILIDDGSPDRSGEICDLYAARDTRFVVIHQANSGVSAARNAGLSLAKGKYVTFLDGDDCLASEYLQKMVILMEEGADLALCRYRRVTPEGKELYDSDYGEKLAAVMENGNAIPSKMRLESEDRILAAMWASGMLSHCYCKLYRTALLQSYGGVFRQDLSYGEDSLFVAEYAASCQKIAATDCVLYNYLSREDSLSATWWKGMLTQRSLALSRVASVFAQRGFHLAQKEAERMRDSINPEFLLEQISDPKLRRALIIEYCALPNYRQMMKVVKETRSLPTRLIYSIRSPRLLELYLTAVLKRRG